MILLILKFLIFKSISSLMFMKIFLLLSLFNGHDSGLCVAKTPNSIVRNTLNILLNFQLMGSICYKIMNLKFHVIILARVSSLAHISKNKFQILKNKKRPVAVFPWEKKTPVVCISLCRFFLSYLTWSKYLSR